jgi:hypothetical protein
MSSAGFVSRQKPTQQADINTSGLDVCDLYSFQASLSQYNTSV